MPMNRMGSLLLLALTGFVLIGCGNNADTDSSVESSDTVEFKKDANADVKEKNDLKKEQDAQVEESSAEDAVDTNTSDGGATLDDLVEGEAEVMESDPDYQGSQDPVVNEPTDEEVKLLQELVEQEAKDPNLSKQNP